MLLKVTLVVLLVVCIVVEAQTQPRMVATKKKDASYTSYHAAAGIIIGVLLAVGFVLLAILGVWYYFQKKLANQKPVVIERIIEDPEAAPEHIEETSAEEPAEVVTNPNVPKKDYSKEKDDVLRKLGEIIDQYGIVKLADGKYQIKNKIVYMKIMGEGVYVRVGGGYVKFEQWIQTYFKDLRAEKARNTIEESQPQQP